MFKFNNGTIVILFKILASSIPVELKPITAFAHFINSIPEPFCNNFTIFW